MSYEHKADGQVPALTGFRALAALMVFIAHYIPQGKSAPGLWIAGYGARGVDFFFVLSGYLFTWLYFDRFTRGTWNLGSYFLRRFARILPPFWTVAFLSWLAIPMLRVAVPLCSPKMFFNLALLQKYMPALDPLVPQGWTLTIEELFYATFPILIWSMSCVSGLRFFCNRKLSGYFCLLALVWLLELALWMKFLPFALGIFLALALQEKKFAAAVSTGLASTLLGLTGVAMFMFMPLIWGTSFPPAHQTHGWAALGLTSFSSLAGVLILLSLLGAAPWRSWFECRLSVFAGQISYSFYLIHMLLLVILKQPVMVGVAVILRQEVSSKAVLILSAFVMLGCCVLGAWMLHAMIEEPCRRIILRLPRATRRLTGDRKEPDAPDAELPTRVSPAP